MDNNIQNIPYIAFESSQARMERINKRLWIAILILIGSLICTNAGWIYYESQWQYVDTTTVSQEATADGNSDINLHGIGDNNYGR